MINFLKKIFNNNSLRKGLINHVSFSRDSYKKSLEELSDTIQSYDTTQAEYEQLESRDHIMKGESDEFILKWRERHQQKKQLALNEVSRTVKQVNDQVNRNKIALSKAVVAYDRFLQKGNTSMKYQSYVDKYSLDKTREEMPQINSKEDHDSIVDHFDKKVGVELQKVKVSDIKPTQNEINKQKVLSMMASDKSLDNVFIVSNDHYLVDGHHRWANLLELNESQYVEVVVIDLPILQLLKRLNQMKATINKDIDDNVEFKLKFHYIYEILPKSVLKDIDSITNNGDHYVLNLTRKVHLTRLLSEHFDVSTQNNQTYIISNQGALEKATQLVKNLSTIIKAYKAGLIDSSSYQSICNKYQLSQKQIKVLQEYE